MAMDQNPKTIEATVIAKDAVDDEPTVATRSKRTKRAAGRARRGSGSASTSSSSVSGANGGAASTAGMAASAASATNVVKVAPSTKKKAEERVGNRVRATRIDVMMSKAELARRAGISVLTIDRVEKGLGCRMDTKRKILEALGLSLADRVRVFGEEE